MKPTVRLILPLLAALPLAVWGAGETRIRYEEIAGTAGLRYQHHIRRFPGPTAEVLEMFTSGGAAAAVGDYDNDGDDDVFLTDSDAGKPNFLLRNDGKMKFADVAAAAGVAGGNDGLSIVADAVWFDYDNDGWRDLLVARFGIPILYHNERNGKFRDVSKASGLNKFGNTISAVAFDYDNDGFLDLMFGNYFKPVNLIELSTPNVLPNDLDNAVNGGGVTLWHNTGKGSFVEATEKAGFGKHTGWTLDLGHGDFDNDGWQDIYLACDYGTDRIYFNNKNGTFRETTETSLGFDTRKGMNADVGDYDRDGFLDVYVTNITDEYMKECNMLWHNNGDGTFTDLSKETATCATLWGWAAKFGDWDNDGWEDLFVVNGLRSAGKDNYIPVLVNMITSPGVDFTNVNSWPKIGNMTWSGYQKKKMFRNLGTQAFKEISADAGVDNDKDGRGLGIADFDSDGRLDIVQTNANQDSMLYRNVTANAGNWVEVTLVGGPKSNRDAIGARITVKVAGALLIREVNGGNGYSGQSSLRQHIGLGAATTIDSAEVRWPNGAVQKVSLPLNKITTITQK
jgi:hypothetical protein